MESQVCLVLVPETTVFPLYIPTAYITTRFSVWLPLKAHSKASIFIFLHDMYGNTYGIAIQMLIDGGPIAANFKRSINTVQLYFRFSLVKTDLNKNQMLV